MSEEVPFSSNYIWKLSEGLTSNFQLRAYHVNNRRSYRKQLIGLMISREATKRLDVQLTSLSFFLLSNSITSSHCCAFDAFAALLL
jgi:hypothetical protein